MTILLLLFPLGPLVITLVNLLTWRVVRGHTVPQTRVSALVPARNEESTIAACVTALLAEPFHEVVVLDDQSTDRTAAILAEISTKHPRLRVLQGIPLPPGWVGKPHACARLAAEAAGDTFVFVDSDVVFCAGGLSRLFSRMAHSDVVTALPRQHTGSPFEALAIAQLHLTYLSWLPLVLIRRLRDPRILAANGQILAISRKAYLRVGGFERVASAIVDDMAFCQACKVAGLKVEFVDGAEIASCRMYGSAREAVDGFSKNLYEGIGGRFPALIALTLVHFMCFVLPWVAFPFAPVLLLGVGANLVQRALIAVRFGHPAWTVPAHLAGILALWAVAVRSWIWTRNGQIRWRGRVYAARADRAEPVASP